MSLTTVRVLDLVERKLKNPERWVKGHEALDKDGAEVDATDKSACKFCLMGAFNAIDVGQKFKDFAASFIVDAVNQKFVGVERPLTDELEKYNSYYSYYLGREIKSKNDCISLLPEFNDAQKVTHADVILAIKTAKALAKDARKRRKTRSRRSASKQQ